MMSAMCEMLTMSPACTVMSPGPDLKAWVSSAPQRGRRQRRQLSTSNTIIAPVMMLLSRRFQPLYPLQCPGETPSSSIPCSVQERTPFLSIPCRVQERTPYLSIPCSKHESTLTIPCSSVAAYFAHSLNPGWHAAPSLQLCRASVDVG